MRYRIVRMVIYYHMGVDVVGKISSDNSAGAKFSYCTTDPQKAAQASQ